jgi:hypothetical protein
MTDSEGLNLGRHFDEAAQRIGEKIVYEGERHVLLFGPNGTGKGTRFLIRACRKFQKTPRLRGEMRPGGFLGARNFNALRSYEHAQFFEIEAKFKICDRPIKRTRSTANRNGPQNGGGI